MMFLSLARNSSCVPLSCSLGLGFIPSPQNKIARFRHSTCQNLEISPQKNQQQSHIKMLSYSIFNGGLYRYRRENNCQRDTGHGKTALSRVKDANFVRAVRFVVKGSARQMEQ